ncbi:hypothetical protein GCM10009639_25010 [Kitasatospora putterlickiae]|uniref:Hemerythrin-like domain-containing protein n=1 Tax=Kitasatospora putterlickiae TaxID=221725 RepID=A0ABN1XY49_9ACTN
MDAIVLLKDDHKTVEKLFKEFEKAGDEAYAEKRRIADQVIEELTVHAVIEEQVFYPAAREAAPDTGDHVLSNNPWRPARWSAYDPVMFHAEFPRSFEEEAAERLLVLDLGCGSGRLAIGLAAAGTR